MDWAVSQDAGVIERVQPRKNIFYRSDELRTKSFAANIDQIIVLVAAEPDFSEEQLVRALISANSQHIPALIVLNKKDLQKAFLRAQEKLKPYPLMGYEVLPMSLKGADPPPEDLLIRFKNKTSLIMGPSGAGKSTFINTLIPSALAQTGAISMALQSGKHTTTSTTLYWLDNNGQDFAPFSSALIDSPGFQEFGLNHIQAANLAQLMPDLLMHSTGCKFYNCTHLHEPGCVVREQVQLGQISASRYKIYGQLFQQLSNTHY